MTGETVPIPSAVVAADHDSPRLRSIRDLSKIVVAAFVVVALFDTWYAASHGDGYNVGRALLVAAVLSVTLLFTHAALESRPRLVAALARFCDASTATLRRTSRRGEVAAFAAGLLTVVLAFGVVELGEPYYFTQDDNLSQFLPVISQACDEMLHGEMPSYTANQWLGMPTTALGVYGLTYPPTCASYAVAKVLLDDPNATLEVFALLHLLAGFVATWVLARAVGMRGFVASAMAAGYVLSGYMLIAGRSWYYMLPIAVWVPLLLYSLHRFAIGRTSRWWAVGTAAVVGLFFHAGNAQMWSYALLFYAVGVVAVLIGRRTTLAALFRVAGALLLGLAIAAPLLVAQLRATTGIVRDGGLGSGFLKGLASMVLPVPLVRSGAPELWGNVHSDTMGELYFSGGLLVTVGGVALVALLLRLVVVQGGRPAFDLTVWLALAGLALVLGHGDDGRLWTLLAALPGFSEFSYPVKFLPFATIFLLLAGGMVCERVAARSERASRDVAVAGAVILGILVYHAAMSKAAFFSWRFPPYPSLAPAVLAALEADPAQGRVLPIAPLRNDRGDAFQTMILNFPTNVGQSSIVGYDPLIAATKENLAADRRLGADRARALYHYGVGWMLEYKNAPFGHPDDYGYGAVPLLEQRLFYAARPVAMLEVETDVVRLWRLPRPRPLAFSDGDDGQVELAVRPGSQGVDVDVAALERGDAVVVNVLHRPGMSYRLDGQRVSGRADYYGRVLVTLPQPGRLLEVRYDGAFDEGFAVAAGLALIAGNLLLLAPYVRRARPAGMRE